MLFLKVINKGDIGETYCIGGFGEKTNIEVVKIICSHFDKLRPKNEPYENLIKFVEDRPGHDKRYSIDSSFIQEKTGWKPKYKFEIGMRKL